MSDGLKICPCGKTPGKLLLVDNGVKWAYATGDCCNEWHVEFRTGYYGLKTKECMSFAVEAWNTAERGNPAAQEAVIDAARNYQECVTHYLETRVGTSPLLMINAEKAADKANTKLSAALKAYDAARKE